ncbi:CPBP family intramembrane glutamic endopeptidase [Staphylococcus casei]|uniref:CPBP family intramembrane metalloprotease n=1 Tax=Staphylococcus casei TaxID=201828 RepID=A0ABZ2WGK9_9STAP
MNINKIRWFEFSYFPLLLGLPFILNIILSLISNVIGDNIFNNIGQYNMGVILDFSVNLIIIIIFLLLNNNNIILMKLAVKYLTKHWKSTLIILITVKIIFEATNKLVTIINDHWNLYNTENQNQIVHLIVGSNVSYIQIITFFSIVIIGPMLEEILYRHLIIGELSKIFPYQVMSIISLIIFALIHVQSINSLYEMFLYLILGAPIIFVYIKSNFNIYVSILTHIFINLTSYFYILLS